MRKLAFLSLAALSLPITLSMKSDFSGYSVAGRLRATENSVLQVQKAMAATVLDPSTMNLGTVGGRADFIRFLYFMVVGPTADYSIPNGPGPEGLVGVIKQLMGSQGIGGALYQMGYTDCASIPSSGSTSATEGAETFTISFGTPGKSIPAHHGSHGGGSYSKSVSIAVNSVPMLKTEFNCESAGVSSGYVRLTAAEDDGARDMELYFLRDTTAQDGFLDFYMSYAGSTYTEKAAVQFKTQDETNYDLFLFRNQDNSAGNDEGSAFGLQGNASTGLVKVHYIFDQGDATLDNTTAIASGSSECISLATNNTSAGCGNIAAPNNVTLGASFTWTIDSLADLTLSSF